MTDDSALLPDRIRDQILAYIRDELLGPESDIGPDDDLLSGELLDSMAVLQLATYVDQAFTIGMQPSDFRVENFQTVNALTRFVEASSTA